MPTNTQPFSVRLPDGLHARLNKALPRYGDKSLVIRALIEKFLDGDIEIKIKPGGVKTHANGPVQLVRN